MKKLLLTLVLFAPMAIRAQNVREDLLGCLRGSNGQDVPKKHLLAPDEYDRLKLLRNGRFELHDYNRRAGQFYDISGKYIIKGRTLTLLYPDRHSQVFAIWYDQDGTFGVSYKNLIFVHLPSCD